MRHCVKPFNIQKTLLKSMRQASIEKMKKTKAMNRKFTNKSCNT